ncbi:MAG: hypothetical protein JST55_10570 [Bacteroidetes bacterium]|nr:hypothetical protein [Bacteroidota bacterium]
MNEMNEQPASPMDKSFKKFVAHLVIVSVSLLTIALLYMVFSGKNEWRGAVFTSFIINFLNVYSGALILVKNASLAPQKFINKVLGSMVLRIFVNVGLIFVCLQFFKFDRLVFVISFFAFYIVFLILELQFITKSFKEKSETKV